MFRFLMLGLSILLALSLEAQDNYQQYLKLNYAIIDSLADAAYEKAAYQQAIPLMQAARAKAQKEFGEQDSTFANYTKNLAFYYDLDGQYDQALPLYEEAMAIQRSIFGEKHLEVAYSLNDLGTLHYKMGNYDQALPLFIQTKAIQEKILGKTHLDLAAPLNNLAALHYMMGQYDQALPLYIQAKDIQEKVSGKEHSDFASYLNNIAALYQKMGDYDKALPLYTQAASIWKKVLGEGHPVVAAALNNAALLHQKMGDYDKALPRFIQAIDIQQQTSGKEHPDFATYLNNLAALHQEMGNYEEALRLNIEVLRLFEKILGAEHTYLASSISNLAFLYEEIGEHEQALPLYKRAANIWENAFGREHPDAAAAFINLGFLYGKMGDYERAWQLLEQVINSQSRLVLNPHSERFDAAWFDRLIAAPYPSNNHLEKMLQALYLAYTLLEQDKSVENPRAKQELVADLATALLRKLRQQLSNESDKLRMLSKSNLWLRESLKILRPEQDVQKAFELSDQNKSVLLYQATKSEDAYRLGNLPDSLVQQNKALLKRRSQLQAQLLENKSEEEENKLRDALNALNQDLDAFEALVKKDYPKYYQLKYQEVATTAQDVQAQLDEKTALIEYALGDSVVHIFCVTKADVIWKKAFIGKEQLSKYIQQLHQSLSDYEGVAESREQAYQAYTEPAYWFYDKLLAPVLKNKTQLNKLIIVTDGELGHLPFETFLVEQAPAQFTPYKDLPYLLKDYRISYNYSASLWKENKEAPAAENNGQILAMAANYSAPIDSSVLELRSYNARSLRQLLTPLPAARKEVEMLQEAYQGFFAFDSLASEKTVKAKASDFAILHFATHGLLDEKRPILSSLALTECNDSTEDNFWQAYEISKMELNADLVVLSACETGYGKFETGNGIASLARSFMYAGVPSLIVSLWQVNDQATKEIMQRLYQNLAKGQPIDEALRQAKLEYIQLAQGLAAHPAFWSPFIQMGKTEAVEIKTKGGLSPWVFVGLGAVVLLGLGGFWMRRREGKV